MVQHLDFQGYSDRLPPQNVDAEEAILGGVLLDPEAIGRVMEILNPDAFYISAHKTIYRAAMDLHSRGLPTDLMTVTAWLKDRELLEKVGGTSRIAQLVDRTLSAANIDQYATLVMEKYMRRRLIQIGGEISQLGFEAEQPLEISLDEAEQKLFAITQDRPQQALTSTADILIETFAEIEERAEGIVLPGALRLLRFGRDDPGVSAIGPDYRCGSSVNGKNCFRLGHCAEYRQHPKAPSRHL